ncbi:MAG: protein kinase, partial [Streptosporangiaceae bacterium]
MQAGTELAGRYVLEQVLGSGAMGDVWRGVDRQLERPVAVKVMRDRLADPRRFQREARIAARLQHPGITVVHDVGMHDGQPFFVMELLHGRDLAAILGRVPNVLALSDHVRAEQVELDFPYDVGDARLTGLAGREVTGFLGLAGAGPVRA